MCPNEAQTRCAWDVSFTGLSYSPAPGGRGRFELRDAVIVRHSVVIGYMFRRHATCGSMKPVSLRYFGLGHI
jgi:hypothetical protein